MALITVYLRGVTSVRKFPNADRWEQSNGYLCIGRSFNDGQGIYTPLAEFAPGTWDRVEVTDE